MHVANGLAGGTLNPGEPWELHHPFTRPLRWVFPKRKGLIAGVATRAEVPVVGLDLVKWDGDQHSFARC